MIGGVSVSTFESAVSKMSSGIDESKSNIISTEDVIDIIGAAISLFDKKHKTDAIGRLQKVRDLIIDGEYSSDKLTKIMFPGNEKPEIAKKCNMTIPLNKIQIMRLKEKHPAAFSEYMKEYNLFYVSDTIADIYEKYPEAPHEKYVYYDATEDSLYWDKYNQLWETVGQDKGNAIAWSYDGSNMYIVHFIDNIFDSGIECNKQVLRSLSGMFYVTTEVSREVRLEDTSTVFKIVASDDGYTIFVNDNKVMALSREMMLSVVMGFRENKTTEHYTITRFVKNLIGNSIVKADS